MTVIVGSGQDGKKRRWILVVSIVAVLVLACAAGVGLRWWQNGNVKKNTSEDKIHSAITEAQNLAGSGKADVAANKVDEVLQQRGLSAAQKYDLYIQKGNIAFNSAKYQDALADYKNAEAAQKAQVIYELLASTEAALGDKPAAVAYYKKAIEYLSPNNPLREDDKSSLEAKITELGGQL